MEIKELGGHLKMFFNDIQSIKKKISLTKEEEEVVEKEWQDMIEKEHEEMVRKDEELHEHKAIHFHEEEVGLPTALGDLLHRQCGRDRRQLQEEAEEEHCMRGGHPDPPGRLPTSYPHCWRSPFLVL